VRPRKTASARWIGTATMLLMLAVAILPATVRSDAGATGSPIPLDHRMHYGVYYAGIRCGSMTLESFAESTDEEMIYHVVLTARSSKFFDGIYKLRSRIESLFSEERMSSTRYHEHSTEKKKVKDKLYVVEFDQHQVRRVENGEEKIIAITSDQVYDPLAYLYRMRMLVNEPGDSAVLTMVTSDGDLDTVAEVLEKRTIKTPFGKKEAIRVVPRPKDATIFSKKGTMSVWLSTDDRKIPYRVEFELGFGRLTAKLKSIEEAVEE